MDFANSIIEIIRLHYN